MVTVSSSLPRCGAINVRPRKMRWAKRRCGRIDRDRCDGIGISPYDRPGLRRPVKESVHDDSEVGRASSIRKRR